MPSRISRGPSSDDDQNSSGMDFDCCKCLRSWLECICCCFFCDDVTDEELAMRKAVLTAPRENDYEGVQKAINAVKEKYISPDKTKSACNMWDPEKSGLEFMTALKWAAEHGHMEMCKLLLDSGANLHCSMYADSSDRHKFKSPGERFSQ